VVVVRSGLLRGVRGGDVVLTVGLTFLGVLLMVADIQSRDPSVRVDSHSWLLVPVFLATTVPVLWWRRDLVAVLAVACAAMGIHVLAFGSLVRCGAGLPLAFLLGFLSGTLAAPLRRWTAFGLTAVLTALVLVRDTAAGVDLLPVALLLVAGLFGIGRVHAHRSQLARELAVRNRDLQRLRDERAALEVNGDRLQMAARLETLLAARLDQLAAAAERGGVDRDPASTRTLLTRLEDDSRRTLDDMREVVGLLRGGEVALAPVPCVAHLDALLARHLPFGARLRVAGDPRLLPASVELSAYRIVEHLVTAFPREDDDPVRVGLTFDDDALEIEVTGPASRSSDLRAALARARERANLHDGSLNVRTLRGHSYVTALLPVIGEA
jgi:signal transduction histidine kinase